MVDYVALKAELDAGHPVTGAYSSDDAVALAQLTAVNRTRARQFIFGSEVFNATDDTEFGALTAAKKDQWMQLCQIAEIDVVNGIAKELERDIFGAGTNTRTALLALRDEAASRSVELFGVDVHIGDIQNARLL